jgi:hypothetical protein
MAILVDFNQVCISSLMAEMGHQNLESFKQEHVALLRHIIFNCLQSYRKKFGKEYGELVICTDNKSWRKGVFSLYKDHRRRDREASSVDWKLIFDTIYQIKNELVEYFPYKVMSIENAEADDVIATLCKWYQTNELDDGSALDEDRPQPVLILSGDGDFVQLQKYPNVKQYSPILKKWIKPEFSPLIDKRIHILQGDKGDGVPNFRSPDNAIVDGIRQKQIKKKELAEWSKLDTFDPLVICKNDEELHGFERNLKMIDLDRIPNDVCGAIINSFTTQVPVGRSKIRGYFIANKMRNMIEITDQF